MHFVLCSTRHRNTRTSKINNTEDADNLNWPCYYVNEGYFLKKIKLLSVENDNFKTNLNHYQKIVYDSKIKERCLEVHRIKCPNGV